MKKIAFIILFLCSIGSVYAQNIPAYKAEDLMQRIAGEDTLYIVNFWATWCNPCVKELPEFNKLQEMYAGQPVKVILVSLDFRKSYPNKLAKFVHKKKLQPDVAWLNETNANTFIPKIEQRWEGSIPATLIVYHKNEYQYFYEGVTSVTALRPLIDKQLALQ